MPPIVHSEAGPAREGRGEGKFAPGLKTRETKIEDGFLEMLRSYDATYIFDHKRLQNNTS